MMKSDRDLNSRNQVISMKSESGREMLTPFLPEEIISKIFLSLPARGLHDVMSRVCRTWRKVIRDPDFTKKHFSRSTNNFPVRVSAYLNQTITLYYLQNDETTLNLRKKFELYHLADGVGLVLAVDRSNDSNPIYLINPITNQTVKLPHPTIDHYNLVDWAVGYSLSTSKYKVVYIGRWTVDHICIFLRSALTRNGKKILRVDFRQIDIKNLKVIISGQSKAGRENQMPFLPEDIIFEIFLLLPANVLQEVMRLVCRTWRDVIRDPVFTTTHFSQLPDNSLFGVQKFKDYFELYSINKDETTWNYTKTIDRKYLTNGAGLILIADRNDQSIIHLLNPITKKIFTLPRSPLKFSDSNEQWAVGYSPSTSKYKVMCIDRKYSKRVYILTVSVDKQWREILDTMTMSITCYEYFHPLGVLGFMYSLNYYYRSMILLDLGKEISYKVDFSEKHEGHLVTRVVILTSSDRIPSIGIIYDYKYWLWHFWELVDFKNGGEWRKFGSIDFKDKPSEIIKIGGLPISPEPIIKRKDEIIFTLAYYDCLLAYNFKKGTITRSFDNVPKGLKVMLANSLVEL